MTSCVMALRRAAKELDITPDQIRYWIKSAGLRTEKRENVVYIAQEGFDFLVQFDYKNRQFLFPQLQNILVDL